MVLRSWQGSAGIPGGAAKPARGFPGEQIQAPVALESAGLQNRVRLRASRGALRLTYKSTQFTEHNESCVIKSYLPYNGNFH